MYCNNLITIISLENSLQKKVKIKRKRDNIAQSRWIQTTRSIPMERPSLVYHTIGDQELHHHYPSTQGAVPTSCSLLMTCTFKISKSRSVCRFHYFTFPSSLLLVMIFLDGLLFVPHLASSSS